MTANSREALTLRIDVEKWPLTAPFRITGHTFTHSDVVLVTLQRGGHIGLGEAAGVYYRNDDVPGMVRQIESLRPVIEAGVNRAELQQLLPAGGARNALDCALWDLEAKLSGQPVWQIASLDSPQPLLTTFTISADSPAKMADAATAYVDARAIKIKLTGEGIDGERVRAVREARPDVWLGIDANQGFTPTSLLELMPLLIRAGVGLIEQPFPMEQTVPLSTLNSPIPIAADESAQNLQDIPRLVGLFDVINIKLDKCGGLTEGLAMARKARQSGLDVMVGNTVGTSLAMAPAFLVGQLSKIVDLDGPIFLSRDRSPSVSYRDGKIHCPTTVWGAGTDR
jgi:L-alanine-DL-glutamate epimerase-like enolase superfamily enzyme